MICIRLKPKSSYRTEFRSDTLFGLCIFALSYVLDESEFSKLLDGLKRGECPFKLSSAFPYTVNSGQVHYYFPKPLIPVTPKSFTTRGDYKVLKKTKKVQFIRHDYLVQVLAGKLNLSDWLFNYAVNSNLGDIQKEQLTPHVSIDRVTGSVAEENGAGQFFTTDEKFLNPEKAGLFIVADGDTRLIKAAFRWLKDFGFGADHAIGKGDFELEFDENPTFSFPKNGDSVMNLSLFTPTVSEAENISAAIEGTQIELRSGRFSKINSSTNNTAYQKPIYPAFKEGSVFKLNAQEQLVGKIFELEKMAEHTIYTSMQPVWLTGNIKI